MSPSNPIVCFQSPSTAYEYPVGKIVLSICYIAPSLISEAVGGSSVGSDIDQRDLFDAEMHDLGQVRHMFLVCKHMGSHLK